MRKLTEIEKQEIINLYESGLNCVEIKIQMGLKGHQQVLNVLTKYEGYIPYKYGRGGPERKYTLNKEYFRTIDTEEKAYILGFLAADGHIDEKAKRVRILVATKDKDILEKIKSCLSNNSEIKDVVRETRFNYGVPLFYHSLIAFNSVVMVKDLVKYGLVHNKTYTLNSSILENIPQDLIRHFLRGYFDGDGNIFWHRKYSSGWKHSISVAGNLEFLQNTFGKYFPTNTKYRSYPKSKQCWSYTISKKAEVQRFLSYLYDNSTIFLNRKYNIYLEACGHLKQEELLETPIAVCKDNQQPSLSSNALEGSTTNTQVQTSNVEDSNGNTSILPKIDKQSRDNYKKFIEDFERKLFFGEDIV